MIQEITPPTLIAEGTRVQGSLTFFSITQVFGVVEGELLQQTLDPIHIGKTGWVNGAITSQGPIVIEGRVEGIVTSQTQVKLLPTATVHGQLIAPSINIRPGAVFEGELKMEQKPQKHSKKAA